MNKSFDSNTRNDRKLPLLKVVTGRSTSAKLSSEDRENIEDLTPCFKHPRHQSSFEPFFEGQSISQMYIRILQEQSKLKHKISQQAKLIQNMYKRPPVHCVQKKSEDKENKEVTFRSFDLTSTTKGVKRFHFPRDVFSQKKKVRNSCLNY